MSAYRPNVAALILNPKGCLLVCERKHNDGAWQFPQGGVDKGESHKDALKREVLEEVGIPSKAYKIVEVIEGYKYDYPSGKSAKKGYKGQKQTYYLCQLKKEVEVDLHYHSDEFQAYDWIKPKKFRREWVPKFKQGVYEQVMLDFFDVEI